MLRIKDLTFTYSGFKKPAIKNISTEILPGELVLLTGESGSGKSTLVHCINGLAEKYYGGNTTGEIFAAGLNVVDISLVQISDIIATIFQNPNTQFFQLNVEDEIVFSLEQKGYDQNTIEDKLVKSLNQVGIVNLRSRDLFTLSSGEKQKVALSSVTAMEQPILLMDEPTANLDIASIKELKTIIDTLKKQGRTILISEHRLWYLKDIADKIIVIKDGQIAYQGLPNALESNCFRKDMGLRVWDKMPKIDSVEDKNTEKENQSLKVVNLKAGVGKNKNLLNNINIELREGQCVAVMGDNGAGKTSLSRVLTGLQKQQKGSIYISELLTSHKKRLGRVTTVAQQAEQQLFADTVYGEFLLSFDNRIPDENLIKFYLDHFDLAHLKERHPQTLSGGEKQRLAIAVSMISNPRIIILDEPTSGMDSRRMNNLAEQIRNLTEQGISVIIITHDIELVNLVASSVFWMQDGTVSKVVNREQFNAFFDDLLETN